MAYNRTEIYNQAIEAIEKNNLFYIEDIVAWLPISRSTFWDYYPDGSDEMDTFKNILNTNKVKTKSSIRAKLFRSNKAAELLALYRLIATPEEHQRLNQQYIDHKSSDGTMTPKPSIEFFNAKKIDDEE